MRRQLWRYGSILLFCGVPLLSLGLIASNVVATSDAHDATQRHQATLSQIVRQMAQHDRHALSPSDTASFYLTSTSTSLARAEIQDRVTKLAQLSGGSIVETQIVGTPEAEAGGTIAVQLTVTIGNRGLRDLLYDIEAGLPLFEISDLVVDRDDAPSYGDAPSIGDRPLHVQTTIRGHWRKASG